jgi:hypothetical protein
MRIAAVVVVLVHALATVALAQQNEVALFISNLQPDRGGGGYGVSFHRTWTPRFSTGISIAAEEPAVVGCVGSILTQLTCTEVDLRTYPVDLTGRFHFINDTRWKPYIGAGVRYVAAPDVTPEEVQLLRESYSDQLNPEIVGGLVFRVTPSFAINAEVKGLFRNPEDYDSLFKASAGVSWRF